jgi:hypothetical protein
MDHPEAVPLHLDYDVIGGRLVVTSPQGAFFVFYGVPIGDYIQLRFSPAPGRFLVKHIMGHYRFICSSLRPPPNR